MSATGSWVQTAPRKKTLIVITRDHRFLYDSITYRYFVSMSGVANYRVIGTSGNLAASWEDERVILYKTPRQ